MWVLQELRVKATQVALVQREPILVAEVAVVQVVLAAQGLPQEVAMVELVL